MTSGVFAAFLVSEIFVDRAKRQRRELTGIEELKNSINTCGLIHPIVIQRSGELVAGERRLTALRELGWTHVSVQFVDDLSEAELRLIELEENVKRADLTWQDQALAIAAYHEARRDNEPDWTPPRTAEELGFSRAHINVELDLAEALKEGVPEIIGAAQRSIAKNIMERRLQRAQDAELMVLRSPTPRIAGVSQPATVATKPPPAPAPILNTSFLEFAPAYSGTPFNFIHCDFPYGVNMQDSDQGGGTAVGTYEDSETVYWRLINCLEENLHALAAPSAHLMFWFSMKFYEPTLKRLTEMGWRVNPIPLVWMKSDNKGILPDHRRGPRQIYETAFLASRGDRNIVRPVANAIAAPTSREIHMSEKPQPMLTHFFRMLVDSSTTMLDPTCGSGTSLRAADDLGANFVLGLELDPTFATSASAAFARYKDGKSSSPELPIGEGQAAAVL